jgi:hypothetical protein
MRFYEIKETSEEVIKKGPPYDPSQSSIVKKFQSELQRLGYFIGATLLLRNLSPNKHKRYKDQDKNHRNQVHLKEQTFFHKTLVKDLFLDKTS